ncbi:MAG: hypothetical protein NC483_06355 [Ruminococcus sp.]|nr:hypothetical protein [Ruminococcus sp.]
MQKIILNDSLIDLAALDLISDKGSEFLVFKHLDMVLKIYKKDYQLEHLSLKELNFLCSLSPFVKRILLPSFILRDENGELIGYGMPLISKTRSLGEDKIATFFEELDILKDDLEFLSRHLIVLRDINLQNTIYNGHIFLIDPGNYLIGELNKIFYYLNPDSLSFNEQIELVRKWNYNKINRLIDMLLFTYNRNIDDYKSWQIIQFMQKTKEKESILYNLDILRKYMNPSLNINEAINEFIASYIPDNPEEKALYLALYK